MKLLAIETDKTNKSIAENYQMLLYEEAQVVWQLYNKGIIREIYFTEHKNAVIVLECIDVNEAEKILAELPLVKADMIQFDVMELNAYSGFGRLFEK